MTFDCGDVECLLDRLNDLPPPSVWGFSPGPVGLREPEPDMVGNMGTNPLGSVFAGQWRPGALVFSLFTAAPNHPASLFLCSRGWLVCAGIWKVIRYVFEDAPAGAR